MALWLAIRYHLVPAAKQVFEGVRVGTLAAVIPVVTLTGFAYWRYWVAVQQLPEVPLSLPEARLAALLILLPTLFIRPSATRRDPVFYSLAAENPTVPLKILILRSAGSRIAYAIVLILALAPLVVRLTASTAHSLLHLINDGLYVVTCGAAATLIEVTCGTRRTLRGLLVLCFVGLLGVQTLLLLYRPWADVINTAANAALLAACWTLYLPRICPLLIQEYFNGLAVTAERKRNHRRRILRGVSVEMRVSLNTFLITGNSVIPAAAALAAYVYLILFLIRGPRLEEALPAVMVLGFGAAFFYGSIFIESARNFNVLFGKVHSATFFRLARLTLVPHCALIGLSFAGIVVLLALLGMVRLAPVLMLASYVVVLPFLSWSTAMIFLNRRLLSGLYYTALALAALVLSVVAPAAYAVYAVVTCAVTYRRGMLRYAALTAEDWG